MLRTAFRRCHNFIHGNEGMPKDAAFWQFLYLISAKCQSASKRDPEPGVQKRPLGSILLFGSAARS